MTIADRILLPMAVVSLAAFFALLAVIVVYV